MDSSKTLFKFCVFCLRDTQLNFKNYSFDDNDCIFKEFIKLFNRFLRTVEQKNVVDLDVNKLKCCDECVTIVKKFCDFYHQYKCLELQLDWMVLQIGRIMKQANKVPSRVSQAKYITTQFDSNQSDGWELVTNLREHIIQSCQLNLGRSLPRLSLRRSVSTLPALFQPVFIASSDGSLSATSDNTNEDCENTAECGDDLEDTLSSHDDVNTGTNTIEKMDETNNINEVDQVKLSVEQGTTNYSSSTTCLASLATDKVDLGTPPVFKTEPVNDQRIQTENSENEISISCISKTETLTKQYNLRRKLPQNTTQQTNDNNDDHVISKNINSDSLSNISSSSFSETSSESTSSSSEEDDLDTKSNQLSLSKIRKLRKKYKEKSKLPEYFLCKSGECRRKFRIEEMYDNHLELHAEGIFSCNFCSKVEANLVLLCSHEHKVHGKAKNQITAKDKGFLCPRCTFKATYFSDLEAHFAHTHFSAGMEPPNRRIFEKCKICNREISNKDKMAHFKACHDTSKLGDKKILKCKKDGCTAYFIQKWQLRYHNSLEHKSTEDPAQKNKIYQCSICLKTFRQQLSLQNHKRHIHKYQLRTNFKNQAVANNGNKLITHLPQESMEKGAANQFKCNFCQAVEETPSALALHEAEVHPPKISSNYKNSKKDSCCPRCPYKYSCKRSYVKHHLHVHLNLLNPECPSACKLCSGGNVYKANSERHFKNFHRIDEGVEPHKCDKCPAYFRKSLQLQMHTIKIHQQENKCEICGKVLSTRISLINHMRFSHPGTDENPDLPLGCDFLAGCKKRFRTQAELDHHKKYGYQRPGWSGPPKKDANKFKCDKCEIQFTCNTSLQTHLAKVHGDRPFVCEECGKAFRLITHFEQHLEFHKGPDQWKWQCAECGKKCASKQKLEVHGRTHTKEKPYVCQFCGEKYAHKHNWGSHLKTKHGNEDGVNEMIGKRSKGNYMKRKGTKRGDCIIAFK